MRDSPTPSAAPRAAASGQVDFEFEGEPLRGLEQNPETQSRWAQMARAGGKVMQFLSAGRYIGNVASGKFTLYGGDSRRSSSRRA